MAKNTVSGKKGSLAQDGELVPGIENARKKAASLHVRASTSDSEMLQYDTEGVRLKFDSADFAERGDEVLSKLHYENSRDYFLARTEWLQAKKAADRPKDAPRIEVLDPLARRAVDKINVRITDPEWEKRNHTFWAAAEDVEEHKEIGYRLVTKDDPVKVRCGHNAADHIALRGKGGADELVLMAVDKDRYEQHLQAVAKISQDKMKNAPRAQLDADLDKTTRGKVKSIEVEEERTKAVVTPTADGLQMTE